MTEEEQVVEPISQATQNYLEFEKYLLEEMPEKFCGATREAGRKAWDRLLIAHDKDPHFHEVQPSGLLNTLPLLTPEENEAIETEFPTEEHIQPQVEESPEPPQESENPLSAKEKAAFGFQW